MDYEKLTAPCGLPCFDCVVYLANDNADLRAAVAQRFGLPVEEAACPGCREVKGQCPADPTFCTIFPCSQEKGVTFCHECSDFPCDSLRPYADRADQYPLNLRVFSLCMIKKMGLQAWAEQRATRDKEEYLHGKMRLRE